MLDIVFRFCSTDSKISLIHYIMYNSADSITVEHEKNKIA